MSNKIFCLMGPTATGKTDLAMQVARHFSCEIISVDSAMIYKGMDIGTAKPAAEILQSVPHHLIDILDPAACYSAGQFRVDAIRVINDIIARGKIPLLVGGTMLYFRILQCGLAELPQANVYLRQELKNRAAKIGWVGLHKELERIDPDAAERIHVQDSMRIQRALEVYLLTQKTLTEWQLENTHPLENYQIYNIALTIDRASLHARIAARFEQMLERGFVDEVKTLYERRDLCTDLPAIRSVGYKQIWSMLANQINFQEMRLQAMAATRQLAKRQMTWLRSWSDLTWFNSEADDLFEQVSARFFS